MMSDNNYKGYPLFNETPNKKLQDWNRSQTVMRAFRDGGYQMSRGYMNQLDKRGRDGVTEMFDRLKVSTEEELKKEVIKSING